MKHKRLRRGFTVVEMIVVVAMIVVLATSTVFALSSWRSRTVATEARQALLAAATTLKDYANMNNGYPTGAPPVMPSNFSPSRGVTVTYISGTATTYCLKAASTSNSTVVYYITQAIAAPTATPCT